MMLRFSSVGARKRPCHSAAPSSMVGGALLAMLPLLAFGQQVDAPRTGTQSVEAYLSENAMQVLYGRDMDVGELGRNEVRV